MKLKYYLRGAGLGIIFATIVMLFAGNVKEDALSDSQIIEKAEKLGMIMPESESE